MLGLPRTQIKSVLPSLFTSAVVTDRIKVPFGSEPAIVKGTCAPARCVAANNATAIRKEIVGFKRQFVGLRSMQYYLVFLRLAACWQKELRCQLKTLCFPINRERHFRPTVHHDQDRKG